MLKKKNHFKSYLEVLPHLKDLIQEDIMVSLTDKSKFIAYYPGDKMKIDLVPGTFIPADDPLRKTISDNKIVNAIVPKELYGLSFNTVTYPIRNNKGECIGAIGFSKATNEEFLISNSLDNLIEKIIQYNGNMQDTSKKILDIYEMTIDISSALEEAFTSVYEVSHSSDLVDKIAKRANFLSNNVEKNAIESKKSMENVVEIIETTSSSSKEIIDQIRQLSASINKIETMVGLINQLSEQTNLIALNTSIEAASVDEHSKGFAVVANEVGDLAEQSKSATIEISNTIKSIQYEINQIVQTISKSDINISSSVKSAKKANENISSVLNNITEVDSIINTISEKSAHQSQISMEISSSIESLVSSVEITASNTQAISIEVNEQTSKFKNFELEIENVAKKIADIQNQ